MTLLHDHGVFRAVRAAVAAVVAGTLAACGGPSGARSGTVPASGAAPGPRQVIRSLGAVPVPSAPGGLATPTASLTRPALLAIGEPVDAQLGSTRALVTALGPAQHLTAPISGATGYPSTTRAVLTMRVRSRLGRVPLSLAQLSVRDETGHVIALTPIGAAATVAGPGDPARLRVVGTFTSGAAALTWRMDGRTVAVWTFNIELDLTCLETPPDRPHPGSQRE